MEWVLALVGLMLAGMPGRVETGVSDKEILLGQCAAFSGREAGSTHL